MEIQNCFLEDISHKYANRRRSSIGSRSRSGDYTKPWEKELRKTDKSKNIENLHRPHLVPHRKKSRDNSSSRYGKRKDFKRHKRA
jgi:hypothetical protein